MSIDKTLISPPLYDTLMSLKAEIFKDLRVTLPAVVQEYDQATRAVRVSIAVAQVLPDGTVVQYPPLVDLPVLTPQGGGIALSFPIKKGDECLIFLADRCIDGWFQNGGSSPQAPLDGRLHDLSDGFALVGPNSLANALSLCLLMGEGGIADALAKVAIKEGKVSIMNASANLAVLLTNLLTALSTMTLASVTSGATQAAITPLIAQLALLLY